MPSKVTRLLALDVGQRRIGVAVTTSGILASPHSVIHRKSKKEDFAQIQRLIDTLEIERVIVGMPYSLSAEAPVGPQARRIKRFAVAMGKAITAPINYFDESYSTVDAAAYLSTSGSKNVPLDAAAAAVILQNYLDAHNDPPPPTALA